MCKYINKSNLKEALDNKHDEQSNTNKAYIKMTYLRSTYLAIDADRNKLLLYNYLSNVPLMPVW